MSVVASEHLQFDTALSQASILVIDDEPGMRNFLIKTLLPRCKRVEAAESAAKAAELLDDGHFDVVVMDNLMPNQTGLDWLGEQRKVGFFADVILITAYADLETAIQALRTGVSDVVLKPFRAKQILNAISKTLEQQNLKRENYLLRHELSSERCGIKGRLLGTSAGIQKVRKILQKIAPLPTTVLFTGASGTGKEVAARSLHDLSDRANKAFVAINCATMSPDRISEDFFGMVSPAHGRHEGLFEHADGGTLFLDEVDLLPAQVQATLLRVLEDHRIRPSGSEREIPVNIRYLFASNSNLEEAVEAGTFLAGLYHRINVINIEMPTLQERQADIIELAAMFMEDSSRTLGMPALELNNSVLLKLCRYDWPGNVRELRNLIERSVILGEFPEEFAGDGPVSGLEAIESLELVEQRHIMQVLDACKGNRAEAARRLGISRKTIDRKCALWET